MSESEGSPNVPEGNGGEEIPLVNWQEKCLHLEHQMSVLREASSLRKTLLEIRGTETKILITKLKALEEAINEEKSCRQELHTRLSTAEYECQNVKDKLRRNLQTLERMRSENEKEVNSLMSNLETSELRCKEQTVELGDAKRKNAELRGQVEELNMKLHENKKFTKCLEVKLKGALEKGNALGCQVALISELMLEKKNGEGDTEGEEMSVDMQKIKNILSQSETGEKERQKKSSDLGEDEGVLMDIMDDAVREREDVTDIPGEESCYKMVDTKKGPQSILSSK